MLSQHLLQNRRFLFYVTLVPLTLILLYTVWVPLNPKLAVHLGACEVKNIKSNVITTKNVAAIIENRPLEALMPLILHFSTVLGPTWQIVLFTGHEVVPTSAPLKRLIDESRVLVRFLPSDTTFDDRLEVSGFLTKAWVWEQLAPASHVLIFQADSILCSNSHLKVDDFLEWDFIGAPIASQFGEGYNGGLSLRNRSMVLDIIKEADWRSEYEKSDNKQLQSVEFEDQWFYAKMKKMPIAKLPSQDVAKTFSVETVWYDKPLGYHQVQRYQGDKMEQVYSWCPENRLVI
jgi:hypothetical protein